ncbi:pyruvate phosphate dikinase PEP/pyruvate- binding protein [Cellulomonas flavigena DSM 20109]|uniref:Pyruvate phosphate dikinase PEP/pyruvate-binding protein n=1 Tax=Cellulomonas flavigena (strain ATCC 482 / DSM 20109 / BCRC 11376 / JCM 18109 / NBRC 3775 / NCIMB 8073 / NRS 134) TaxID=446466 RepID=D5UHV0_CELFN|nr:PEP/pyruvate-binding domain-containing protein [Cellulomonas flavigena]ADG73374.1 pyruvate phosphate dikinase PEP/pyruvate- binding protein [Cellulomonas flavigena DSM 20109]
MLVPLPDAVASTCGAKAAHLATLLRAGLPVPAGVVVPFARDTDATLRDDLRAALAHLGGGPVAVRSSARGEDGADASGAGQHETVLAVRGADAVLDAVRACRASLWSPRARAYREAARSPDEPAMAVLVQRLVDADVAGVAFTPDDPGEDVLVDAAWGLGVGVVGGTVTPDAYRLAADGTVTCVVADKRTRVDRSGAETVVRDVPTADRARRTLDEDDVRRIAALARRAADALGRAQDVEWALAGGVPWVLQARPVTAAPPRPPAAGRTGGAAAARPSPATLVGPLVGTPGSRGTATGPVRVVRGPADFARVRPGDVLVCPWTDPSWTPLLGVVAGVVTETGGLLSHAAIVARERGVPAVLGVTDATRRLRDGALVTLDGAAGTVVPHP